MNKDPIISAYKKFIYVVIFFIAAISILISALVLKPFYDNLIAEDKSKYYQYSDALRTQIENKITEYKHVANQISTRTKAKSVLIEYNKNAISFEETKKTLRGIFSDALKDSSIQGIMRMDDEGKILVKIGTTKDVVNFQKEGDSCKIDHFVDNSNGVVFLTITTPLYDNKEYIGSDVVTFRAKDIEKIIDQNKMFSTMDIQLLDLKKNILLSNNPSSAVRDKYIENVHPILNTKYVLKTAVSESQLHLSSNEKIKEIIYTILVILLVSLVGIYFVGKKLLGLVEVKIARNKELQNIKAETAKFATIGYILFAIEHEWRKPLNYLCALSAKFQHKFHNNTHISEKEFQDFLIIVDDTVGDMSQTMTDFKQVYLPSYKKEEIQLGDLISQTVEYFKKNKNTKKIKIDYSTLHGKISTYSYAWRYILLNLLQNSHEKFLESNKDLLHIYIGFDGKVFTFEDNAGGVEDISKILDAFYTTKKFNNSGIGLLIVKSLVEDSLGGKIFFSNTECGLKVSISLEDKVN